MASERGKLVPIDSDLWQAAAEYMENQLETMERFGKRPALLKEELDCIIYKCAKSAQKIRNWNKKREHKLAILKEREGGVSDER